LITSESILRTLVQPDQLLRREEAIGKSGTLPREPGVYGWYFTEAPSSVPVDGCHECDGSRLLYVRIAPTCG